MGYSNDKFIEVRGTVNRNFHIYEEYEAEKDGTKQIFFLIEPKMISKPDKPSQNGKINLYYGAILEEIKKYLRKLPKDEYDDLCEQIRIDETIEIPIVLPENITGFRRPHLNSEARKKGYNLYVKVTGLDF